jgi:hypothetical protein
MRYLTALIILFPLIASAQAIYDANGAYKGYQQTSPSGVTTTYTPQGQSIGSSQVDNGQTNYYSPAGTYQGTATAIPASELGKQAEQKAISEIEFAKAVEEQRREDRNKVQGSPVEKTVRIPTP